jgi:hypothetical protein
LVIILINWSLNIRIRTIRITTIPTPRIIGRLTNRGAASDGTALMEALMGAVIFFIEAGIGNTFTAFVAFVRAVFATFLMAFPVFNAAFVMAFPVFSAAFLMAFPVFNTAFAVPVKNEVGFAVAVKPFIAL